MESTYTKGPVFPWIGGKRLLAPLIVERLAVVPHVTYAEPFVGAGGVFLRRRQVSRAEIVNDLSGDVATFFRVLQRHFPQFMDVLRFQVTSRTEFERLLAQTPDTLTDLERAARFLYLQRVTFGGKVKGRTFGVSVDRPGRFNLNTLAPRLQEMHERLAGVVIERLDFETFIRRYDRPDTLFYCDPPYVGCEGYYGEGLFVPDDLIRLATALRACTGNWLLSINDHPTARAVFDGCRIDVVPVRYSVHAGEQVATHELLISP